MSPDRNSEAPLTDIKVNALSRSTFEEFSRRFFDASGKENLIMWRSGRETVKTALAAFALLFALQAIAAPGLCAIHKTVANATLSTIASAFNLALHLVQANPIFVAFARLPFKLNTRVVPLTNSKT